MKTVDVTKTLEVDGERIAYRMSSGDADRCGLVWLGGFHSDMLGEKAAALHAEAEKAGRTFVRFDYFGHGESSGAFKDGTIGRWRNDAIAVIDQLVSGKLVLVGSSMGGWVALLVAMARADRVAGLSLIAPAPDFTERLMWDQFTSEQKRQIMEAGRWQRPSPYEEDGYPIMRELIEDGRKWLVLDQPKLDFEGPVRILHGGLDEDVPPKHSRQLVEKFRSDDVVWTLVKDGDHRLSRPQDVARMVADTLALADQVDGAA